MLPMSTSHIPNGFTSITPYVIVNDATTFSRFLVDAFEAEIVDEHIEDGIFRHGAYRVFGSMIEASEGGKSYPPRPISIHLYVPDCDAVYTKALEVGGKSVYELADMPYGERSGGVEDPCGNYWWIATQKIDMYPNN